MNYDFIPKALILDFDGVFTNNKVFLNSEGEEFVMCDRGDGLGINMINSLSDNFYQN